MATSNGTDNGGTGTASVGMFPATSIASDAPSFFATLLSSSPRRADALSLLAGPVALYMQVQSDPQVAALYLQAVARHVVPEATAAAGAMAEASSPNPDEAKHCQEILEAVGIASSKCTPRSAISQSGILPALTRLIASPSVLSVAHVELLQCGLLAGQYRYIRRSLNEWPRPLGGVTIQQVLRYFYYRGMIHMGCDEWHLAIRSFWTCVTMPSDVVSAISIAAWKKMVLCQCLVEPVTQNKPQEFGGKPLPTKAQPSSILTLPAAASQPVVRFFTAAFGAKKNAGTPAATSLSEAQPQQQKSESQLGVREYYELVNAFCQGDRAHFLNLKQASAALWNADGNAGMINRLDVDLQHRHVYQLSRIYSVVSLSQLSVELQLSAEQVQALLLQLSAKGMVVNVEADGMVSFPDTEIPENDQIDHNMEEIMVLADRIRQLDVAIATTPRYQHLKGREKTDSRSTVGPRGVADL